MNKTHMNEDYKRMGKNFVTPDIKEAVTTSDNRIVELSTGIGMKGEKIWGVSEFKYNEEGRLETTRREQMHRSASSARRHFNVLLGSW